MSVVSDVPRPVVSDVPRPVVRVLCPVYNTCCVSVASDVSRCVM